MASYKVPQDVEADDKLLGPFSFRQFIYLIIAVLGIAIAWGFSRIFIPLAVIPLPIILLFGALALPLRKDQPMEIYLAAIISFYLKPRKRTWQPDGIQSLVEIVAPRVVEVQRTKDLSQNEAERRLSYLADIADTRGWSVRGITTQPMSTSSMNADAFYAAQQTPDMLDESTGVGRSLDMMIAQADERRRQEMVARMSTPAPAPQPVAQPVIQAPVFVPTPIADPYSTLSIPTPVAAPEPQDLASTGLAPNPHYNPYPSMHQSVIDPMGDRVHNRPVQQKPLSLEQKKPETTSDKHVSPDIMNLANNSDLSIETIAHEARRIQEKEAKALDDEVVISLH